MEKNLEETEKKEAIEEKNETIDKKKKKKNKKKKEKQSEEKKNSENPLTEEDPQIKYEKELQWCISQIRNGITTNNLDIQQGLMIDHLMILIFFLVKESHQVLAILESETAPLIKKRHLMNVIFGDYRKLMKK